MRPRVVCLHLLAMLMFASTVRAVPMPVKGGKGPARAPAAADEVSDPTFATAFILDTEGNPTKESKNRMSKDAIQVKKSIQEALLVVAKQVLGVSVPLMIGSIENPSLVYVRLDIKGSKGKASRYVGWIGYLGGRYQSALYYREGEGRQNGVFRIGKDWNTDTYSKNDKQFCHDVDLEAALTPPETAAGKRPLYEKSPPLQNAKLPKIEELRTPLSWEPVLDATDFLKQPSHKKKASRLANHSPVSGPQAGLQAAAGSSNPPLNSSPAPKQQNTGHSTNHEMPVSGPEAAHAAAGSSEHPPPDSNPSSSESKKKTDQAPYVPPPLPKKIKDKFQLN
ncbi:hypothetical protein BDP27DRAFT_1317881 [Rhodocollybia butyracea]|uniref:Uncharacterized protein n=1 Tax=Rhodocollybia butyracea TaxID=206335 RepID=A0A9P5PWY9_9AGAR|nr:hypothetical protein BDP27DRAFT_1317881 [Rhodocollybia butyracea]